MTLRELIIKKRTESNMTQGELSEKSGITQSRISEFESGKREMGSDNIDKLLAALEVTIDDYEKSYLIIYHNMDLKTKTGKRRTEEFIKELFWNEAPEDWDQFDGELSVRHHQSFGVKDASVIIFYSEYWEKVILEQLRSNNSVFRIELM